MEGWRCAERACGPLCWDAVFCLIGILWSAKTGSGEPEFSDGVGSICLRSVHGVLASHSVKAGGNGTVWVLA